MRKIQRDTNSGKLKVNSWQGKPKKILMRKLLKAFKVAIKRQLKKKIIGSRKPARESMGLRPGIKIEGLLKEKNS